MINKKNLLGLLLVVVVVVVVGGLVYKYINDGRNKVAVVESVNTILGGSVTDKIKIQSITAMGKELRGSGVVSFSNSSADDPCEDMAEGIKAVNEVIDEYVYLMAQDPPVKQEVENLAWMYLRVSELITDYVNAGCAGQIAN